MNPQCNTCKHYKPDRSGIDQGSGQCRFHAPVQAVDFENFPIPPWPSVLETDGCGQHSPKVETSLHSEIQESTPH